MDTGPIENLLPLLEGLRVNVPALQTFRASLLCRPDLYKLKGLAQPWLNG